MRIRILAGESGKLIGVDFKTVLYPPQGLDNSRPTYLRILPPPIFV